MAETEGMNSFVSNLGPYLIAGQVVVIVLIAAAAYWLIKKNRVKKGKNAAPALKKPGVSIRQMIENAQKNHPGAPIDLELDNSAYPIEKCLEFNATFRIKGRGTDQTKIVSPNDQPAIRVENAKDCNIEGVHIAGSIQCDNSELNMENCHVEANREGVCIEANNGSTVTFSGTINSEGGIAIHARGDSKIILKPPYKVSPDDYVVLDPKSRVSRNQDGNQGETGGGNSSNR